MQQFFLINKILKFSLKLNYLYSWIHTLQKVYIAQKRLRERQTRNLTRRHIFQSKNLPQFAIGTYSYLIDSRESLILPNIVNKRCDIDDKASPLKYLKQ